MIIFIEVLKFLRLSRQHYFYKLLSPRPKAFVCHEACRSKFVFRWINNLSENISVYFGDVKHLN